MAAQPPYPSFGLEGKRVVITGAGGGLGLALVSAFHRAGASIIACDRSAALLDALPPAAVAERHVFDMAGPAAAVRAAGLAIPRPDVLVSNAGASLADSLPALDSPTLAAEIQLNLTSVIELTRALLPAMAARREGGGGAGGSVVLISSVNALAHYGNPAYSAAKAGQLALARAVAVEYGAAGIRANAVLPGSMRTQVWERRFAERPGLEDRILEHYPAGRMVSPDEVASAALFLASGLAGGITGAELVVDGGLTAGNLRMARDIIGEGGG